MRIASKIVLLVSLSVAITMGIVGWISLQKSSELLYERIENLLTSNLDFMAEEFNERSWEIKQTADIIANNPAIPKALFLDESIGINSILNQMAHIYPFYNYIMIITPDGEVFAVSTSDRKGVRFAGEELLGLNVMNTPLFGRPGINSGTVVGDPGPDPLLPLLGIKERASQWFVTPVFKGTSRIGWIVLSYDWLGELSAQLSNVRKRLMSVGNPVIEVAIVDEKNNALVSSMASREKITPASDQIRQEKQLSFGNATMNLVIISDRTKINEPVTRIRNLFLGVMASATILLVGILYVIINRAVLAKLQAIHQGSIAFKSGNLGYRLPPMGHDELGLLASTFNEMGQSLQNAAHELELKVEERTAELGASQEKFQTLFSVISDAVLIFDAATFQLVEANDAAVRLYGWNRDELLALKSLDISADLEASLASYAETREKSVIEGLRYHKKKDGTFFPVEIARSFFCLRGRDYFCGVIRDITERKRAEEELQEGRENFRAFFETMDDIIIVGEPDGQIIYSNAAGSRKLGYSPEELKTMHVLDLHPREKRLEAERIFAEMFKGERDACPLPLAKKDGVYLPVETRIWFGKWSGKDCIFGLSKDLSKEQAALQKFNRLFNGNPAPMAVSSLPERKFTEVNDAFLSTMGFSRDEVVGKTSEELGLFVEPEIQSHVALALQDEGSVRDIEMKVRKKDGTILDGLFFGEIIDNQGQKSLLSLMVDITGRKRLDEQLKQAADRYETVANFTYDWEYWIDHDGCIIYMSPSCERITGY